MKLGDPKLEAKVICSKITLSSEFMKMVEI